MKKEIEEINRERFLVVNKEDMEKRDIDQLDFIMVTGDAYVDHPSFGHAIIARWLEKFGYSVGIISQPDWRTKESFKVLGEPRLGFLVNSGNIDSMVNHYTASKRHRKDDLYSPGGKTGKRPDRAVIVYSNRIREAYGSIPIIIGGIEASLRRFAHYDYWDDKVRRSILIDSKADLLIYGMGERPILAIAEALEAGLPVEHIIYVDGTCYVSSDIGNLGDAIFLPSFDNVTEDGKEYNKAFMMEAEEQDHINGETLVQPHGERFLIQNRPAEPLSTEEMDSVYGMNFTRRWHPIYDELGGVPALNEIKFSITAQRGCFGGCSFCALNFHQGRTIQPRSNESIVDEAKQMTKDPEFKGYIHDVGGPTANFRKPSCKKQLKFGVCKKKQCLFPEPCKNLEVDHQDFVGLLKEVRELPGVQKVFIRSGLRFDYIMYDRNKTFLRELVKHHISGQLKVAPEHVDSFVLSCMGKPDIDVYDAFKDAYFHMNNKCEKNQYLVPYLISGHPGSDLDAAIKLAEYVRDMGYNPEQIQEFYPTPGTLSTAMYYSGFDPRTKKPVYVPKTNEERSMQRALIQYRDPRNHKLVLKALAIAGREDLIGFGPKALIRPYISNKKRR